MEDIIVLNNVWKKYNIGSSKKLTETISSFFSSTKEKNFWALKNISLEIKKGEVIGIIGPNGSGKSTLLKILSGISFPSKGYLSIDGKVASLLELGTGFHPELTGRENVYLYGAILGIDHKLIKHQFDQIIKFSGVGKFINTPLKHYSSGMYIRLAFSVVTHLDFDILLIDEVLAIGDAQFQKKSFAKIQEINKQNKTIIVVSHDLQNITKLCDKVILLKNGRIEKVGTALDTVNYYQKL
ncbi:ABC transporter ATP-binding protein [Candidatus Daviesbacteria bacterium]|nr:ABC transporter ATP-binding protein [Candidatus Daviesbacteria bacterium]